EIARDLRSLKEELGVEARLRRTLEPEKLLPGKIGRSRDSMRTLRLAARRTFSADYFIGEVKRRKSLVAAALVLLVGSIVALTYSVRERSQPNVTNPTKRSIAVLPFEAISATDRDDIYEIGIADSLIHRLSSMSGFVVRQLGATREYKDLERDQVAVGKEQQVDYVIAANYQLNGGRIRITAKLFNIASGQIERTYQVEKDASNVLTMQDEIAAEVGDKLLTQFATIANRPYGRRGTSNEEAYRFYLHGMYLANQRSSVDAPKAVQALEKAVALDPDYALAWAGLAYAQRAAGLRTRNAHEAHQKSMTSVNRALALDPNLSEAHSALCENRYLYEWDFLRAEQDCRRAIELNPNSSQAHEIFARYLMGRGRHEEAIAEIKVAIDLDPTSRFVQRNYGRALFYARQYREAAEQFKRVLAMDENFVGTYPWVTSALVFDGNEAEAFEWLLKLLSLRKTDEETVQIFKNAFNSLGWRGVLREWVIRLGTVGGDNFDGAIYSAQLGNKDKAFEYLEKVYQQRELWITYIQVDPRLDSLRDDPRYVDLVKRVEAK
ncbi:MAG TPA: hypothetical protein VIB00_08920, partial [Pyrinomonadaceae bacterium]